MIVHTRLYLKPKAFQIFSGIDSNWALSTDLKSMPLKLVCGKALWPSYQVLINIPWRVTQPTPLVCPLGLERLSKTVAMIRSVQRFLPPCLARHTTVIVRTAKEQSFSSGFHNTSATHCAFRMLARNPPRTSGNVSSAQDNEIKKQNLPYLREVVLL